MATNDEELALLLHKELNAVSLRARRGHGQELSHQQSLDRFRRELAAKPRSKRTNSSSQDHPSSKKRRTSDPDDHGHTSACQRHSKQEPTESDHSGHGGSDGHPGGRHKGAADSRDSGMAVAAAGTQQQAARGQQRGQRQQRQRQQQQQGDDLDPLELLQQHSHPAAAAAYAAHVTQQRVRQQHETGGTEGQHVKVFYAGVRWGLSLPRAAVRSRPQLAKALNDAFVGDILSVGQGEGLRLVFVDASGAAAELGPTKWGGGRSHAARWRALAKTAVRIYVR